jgi:hypothetical protein
MFSLGFQPIMQYIFVVAALVADCSNDFVFKIIIITG